ncbi:MAG: DUF4369 domain-containing protein [Tannerellaceae bacterium]|jgi:hypothetical protein|nr:DUF4369 domain-containing protein [Tannerellaceae bacterium]
MKRCNLSPNLSRTIGRGLCLLLLCLLGCREQEFAVIEGRLPDARYDGEFVYLVPLRNATAANVDSARIQQDAFRFERPTDRVGEEVFIVRTRPLLRLALQELLIILEPGRLHLTLDTLSSARGTALNDSLQQWKKWKETQGRSGQDDAQYNYRFVMHNRGNAAGRLVYELSKSSFTPQQRQTLQMLD